MIVTHAIAALPAFARAPFAASIDFLSTRERTFERTLFR